MECPRRKNLNVQQENQAACAKIQREWASSGKHILCISEVVNAKFSTFNGDDIAVVATSL
jgi:hypothetical protein